MPRLQVLQRTADPSAQLISEAGTGISSIIQRKQEAELQSQALKVKAMQVRINAKNAQTEIDKVRLTRVADGLDFMLKLKEQGANPQLYLPAIKNAFGDTDTIDILNEAGKAINAAPGTPAARLQEAKIGKTQAETDVLRQGLAGGAFGGAPTPGAATGLPLNMAVDTITSDGKVTYKNVAKPTVEAKQREMLLQTENMRNMVDNIVKPLASSVSEDVQEYGLLSGMGASMAASLSGGKQFKNLRRYMSKLPTISVAFYRAVSGDQRVNNEDARDRAMPLFWRPDLGESLELKDAKFDDMDKLLEARERLLRKGIYVLGPNGELITPVEWVAREAGVRADEAQPDEAGFVPGKLYTDSVNNSQAIYLGNGEWQEVQQ